MTAGRPTKYDPAFCEQVSLYLSKEKDKRFEHKLQVNLPTIENFSTFLGVALSSIYKWAQEHKDFSESLELIKIEQKKRLLNSGLSGDYNSTIAKLILSANHGLAEKSQVDSNVKASVKMGEIKIGDEPLKFDVGGDSEPNSNASEATEHSPEATTDNPQE